MAKKKNLKAAPLFTLLAVVCGIVAICMMFVESVKVVGFSTTEYPFTGLQATFGYTTETIEVSQLAFSFMNLLPYILLAVAIVFAVLNVCGIAKSGLVKFIVAGLFVVSGILFFCEGAFTVLGDFFDNKGSSIIGAITSSEITVKLSIGAIVAGICSVVGGGLMLIPSFMKK